MIIQILKILTKINIVRIISNFYTFFSFNLTNSYILCLIYHLLITMINFQHFYLFFKDIIWFIL
jgi:hypothetical protein